MHKKPGDEAADFLCFLFKNYLGHGTKSHTAPVYTGATISVMNSRTERSLNHRTEQSYRNSCRTVIEQLVQQS